MKTNTTRNLVLAALAVASLTLFAPGAGHARLSLEPGLARAGVLSASALSLPGNPSLAFESGACAARAEAPVLRAAELSLPGEVIEDVLLPRPRPR
ncbi:MAG TPA: hypothetical protein PK668_00990 [Myxococcota bacterium]|nr:hypothetical protein [Myxococcota bacterium]HRY96676.1 hypothetical protein [Myxococcota bacterium]HSA20586.1 hypothetical protein [Myxococcota bacterium]